MIGLQPAADSIARVVGSVLSEPAYQWRDESSATLTARRYWRALIEWLDRLAGDHPRVFLALQWIVVAVLVAIAVHAVWVLIRTARRPPRPAGGSGSAGVAPVRDAGWYRQEADRLARAGRYTAAIQAEFVRLLLELDHRDLLRFHPAKTPREYLRDNRLAETPRRDFADLIGVLYRFAFAGDPCDEPAFAAFRARAVPERYVPQS